MGLLKKKKHAIRPKWMNEMIFTPVNILLGRIKKSLRYEGRVRLANMWARGNPKKLWTFYCIISIVLICLNLIPHGNPEEKASEDPLRLSGLVTFDHRLEFIDKYNQKHDILREELTKLGNSGLAIAEEMDSLLKLSVKTHKDSVRLINLYQILNSTINTKLPNESEEN